MEAHEHLSKIIHNWIKPKTYTGNIIDAGDGSGDCILEFDPEMIKVLGWQTGDQINIEVNENNEIVLQHLGFTSEEVA